MIEYYRIDKNTNQILGKESVVTEESLICKEYKYEKVKENDIEIFADETKDYFHVNSNVEVRDKDSLKLKTIALKKINKEFKESIGQLVKGVPEEERATWTEQKNEAISYLADNTVETPLLDRIFNNRTKFETKEELAQRVVYKSNLYTEAVGEFVGIRQQKEDELEEEDV